MSEANTLTDCVGPDLALSEEDREEAERLIEAIDSVPTVDRNELRDRYFDKYPARKLWDDEGDVSRLLEGDYRPDPWVLPGFGEAYDGTDGQIPCGAEITHFCADHGHTVDVGRTCARSRCPRCAPAWVCKRAPRLVSRIHEAAAMMSANLDGTPVYKHHVALSPPDDWLADVDDPTEALYDIGHEVMDAINMEGVMVYHPFRGADDPESDADGFDESHEDDRGFWQNVLFEGLDWEDVREQLQNSPHLHLIGACPWVPGGDVTAALHEDTDWIMHRITERNGSAISLGDRSSVEDDLASVARAVTYALSHGGIGLTYDAAEGEIEDGRARKPYRRHGSAFNAADLRTLDKAKEAVHRVAPDTLGIPSMEIECRHTVDDDGVPCRGDLVCIDDAPEYLDDPDWRESVPPINVEALRDAWERWEEAGGWQAFVDNPPD